MSTVYCTFGQYWGEAVRSTLSLPLSYRRRYPLPQSNLLYRALPRRLVSRRRRSCAQLAPTRQRWTQSSPVERNFGSGPSARIGYSFKERPSTTDFVTRTRNESPTSSINILIVEIRDSPFSYGSAIQFHSSHDSGLSHLRRSCYTWLFSNLVFHDFSGVIFKRGSDAIVYNQEVWGHRISIFKSLIKIVFWIS